MRGDEVLFGPWVPGVEPAERKAQLRALATLVAVFYRTPVGQEIIETLRDADSVETLSSAFALFNSLPTLTIRQILSVFAFVHRPKK